ncbi:MAG: hypothetical protein EOO93_08530, partial [Pedobacter sp.]
MKIEINQANIGEKKINLYQLIAGFFLFFSFFPYLKIVETGSDLQPLSFIIGVIYLFTRVNLLNFDKRITLIFITMASALVFFFIEVVIRFDIVLFRGVYSYTSILVHSLAAYDILKRDKSLLYQILELAIWIWFVVGLIQSFIFPTFLTFLLSRGGAYDAGSAGGRGVLSLAVEPTFYGIQCFFMLLFVFLIRAKNGYGSRKFIILVCLCIIQIVIFARSSMVMVFVFLTASSAVFTYVFRKPLYAFLALIGIGLVCFGAMTVLDEDSRIKILLNIFLDSPDNMLANDRSINERISDIYYSISGFFDNPIGHGLNGWQIYLGSQPNDEILVKNEQSRIMSFLGSFLFELGIFSFFLI